MVIVLISFFSLSCERKEICSLNSNVQHLASECDSLERLLYLTRAFYAHIDSISPLKYYIIGSESELMEKGIITRVSGLSREFKISHSVSKFHFLCECFETLDSIVVRGKYVRLVGSFDPEHYTITGSDKDNYHILTIRDKERFWAQNMFLVITHK